ncbi:MAG: undecaprenyldiphospho-muramoylpentapeptide beta-N-acetylglucosaminyltransferase [Verrucomicrobiales bacterium]|nr:undecaprenyldiphospho-muramoylpentapeptide beta-N-acetylglucosaminyltransferase [Verrucomicrobiales bacterium]
MSKPIHPSAAPNQPSAADATAHPSKSVLIACGGTGGHLFPGIAVAELLQAQGHRVRLLISEKRIDTLAASGHPELTFERLPFLAMPRPWSPKMLGFLSGLLKGRAACRRLIAQHQVDTVLGMGGFTSFAPLWAGRNAGCATFIHESNAIPGKANRLNARYSDTVLCGLDACRAHFPKHPRVLTVGTPIRSSMRQPASEDPRAHFQLQPDKKTLLIMGGSQGARGVNQVVGMSLDLFQKLGLQVLHITGPSEYEAVRDLYARHPLLPQHVAAFCHRMDLAYRAADLAIARSGASSLTELGYFGLPSLLIPYPYAADDHQTRNAEVFSTAGAARLLPEATLNATLLGDHVAELLTQPGADEKRQQMAHAATHLTQRDSAEQIARLIAP